MIRVQVDNSVRYSVHLCVTEDGSYVEIKDRFNKKTRIVPLSEDETAVKIHLYKSRWYYRLYSGIGYGHINIELPDKTILNSSIYPEECGILNSYDQIPDHTIGMIVKKADMQKAIEASKTPVSLWNIFSYNCFKMVAIAVTGEKNTKELFRLINQS